jgi:hypothetical protein
MTTPRPDAAALAAEALDMHERLHDVADEADDEGDMGLADMLHDAANLLKNLAALAQRPESTSERAQGAEVEVPVDFRNTDFGRWILQAYRDAFEPGQTFTIHNMAVAYMAGQNRNEMRRAHHAGVPFGYMRPADIEAIRSNRGGEWCRTFGVTPVNCWRDGSDERVPVYTSPGSRAHHAGQVEEAVRRDAGRYRTLRDVPATALPEPLRQWLWNRPFGTGDTLDGICDAARAQLGGKGGE